MIITKLKGGLGNQMFQYAVGLFIASRNNEELKMDASGYDDPRYVHANTPRTYRMFAFNLTGKIASGDEIKKYKYPFGVASKMIRFLNYRILKRNLYPDYHPEFFKKNSKYIEGYFQSEKNFIEIQDKIRNEFRLKKEYESENYLHERNAITPIQSVSVHIRRGDYVSDPKTNYFHGIYLKDYYVKAMEIVKSKIDSPLFYFFSDDIEWVKNEFGEDSTFHFVSNPKLEDYEELMLMSACAHNIIANSSFSWWGAWLNNNPNKLVIAPKKWLNVEPNPHQNIIPELWVTL